MDRGPRDDMDPQDAVYVCTYVPMYSSAVSSRVLEMHVLPLETFVPSSSAPSTFAASSKNMPQARTSAWQWEYGCQKLLDLAAKVLGADDDNTKVSSGRTCMSRTREETALDSHWGGEAIAFLFAFTLHGARSPAPW